jgi:phosphatidylglycerol:prolipoprotein diacylglycerol transferase
MIHVPTHPAVHIGFDLAAWLAGAALARGLYRWRLKERITEAAGKVGPGYFVSLGAGAVIGGYLAGSLVSFVGPAPTLSHSIAGVLAGAIVAVELYKAVRGITGSTGVAFTGALALGIAVGRWGCLFSGLKDNTYGSPTALPWAVDLGDGIGRHPAPVYESLAMLAFLALYLEGLRRRAPWAMRRGFYVLIGWYGAQRFVWEFLKPYPRLWLGLDLFQLMALGLLAYGWIWFLRDARRELAQERALSVLRPDHEPV